MKKKLPSIVIYVSGGVVQSVIGSQVVRIRILDEDNAEANRIKHRLLEEWNQYSKTHKEVLI